MNTIQTAGLILWTGVSVVALVAVTALAALRPWPLAYADGAGPYEAHLRLECFDRSTWEGDAYRAEVQNLHGKSKGNDHMKVYWTTIAMTADSSDYQHMDGWRQKSNEYQRWTGKMGRNFPTTEDVYSELDEKYQVKFRNASRDRPDGDYDGWAAYHWCTVTIWDDDGVGAYETSITSSPADGEAYRAGERIEITMNFTDEVVADEPDDLLVPIRMGSGDDWWRAARYESGSGTDTLVFVYDVKPKDWDENGVSLDGGFVAADGTEYGFAGSGEIRSSETRGPINPWYRGTTGHPVKGTPPS